MSLEHTEPSHSVPAPRDDGGRGPGAIDPERLSDWLAGAELRGDDGQVLSWSNPTHPGYHYPEATALWLSWAAWRRELRLPTPPLASVQRSASKLLTELRQHGSLGRGGQRYLFDTGLALHALTRASRVSGWVPCDGAELCSLSAGLDAFLEADSPSLPAPASTPRWSDTWGGHLLRSAALTLQAGRWLDHPPTVRRAQRVIARAERIAEGEPCYLHGLAYQAEGDLLLAAMDPAHSASLAAGAAARLARLQRSDGLLPGWSRRPDTAHCDTTAQAVRLWAATDPERYASPIARALATLGRLQHPSGGIPYHPGSRDLTSWVGLFADQALLWVQRGADPLALL
jgi:hypothetical protein